MFYSYKGHRPIIDDSVFLAEGVIVTGDVQIEEKCSIWYHTVIRGDVSPTRIGKRVNIQEHSILHQSPNMPLLIEDDVTIGHRVTLHSCTIKAGALIGMNATILDGAIIGEGAFIGAGSLVTPGTKIPPHTLAFGSPARVIRPTNEHDRSEMKRIVQDYVEKGQRYKQMQQTKK